jgi:hypothetical protein
MAAAPDCFRSLFQTFGLPDGSAEKPRIRLNCGTKTRYQKARQNTDGGVVRFNEHEF